MRRMCFSQYQASSAALGGPEDGDCYLMHKLPYPKGRKKLFGGIISSEALSLRAAVLREAVFRSKIVTIVIVMCYQCARKRKCVHVRAYTECTFSHAHMYVLNWDRPKLAYTSNLNSGFSIYIYIHVVIWRMSFSFVL